MDRKLAFHQGFLASFGLFHAAWGTLDVTMDLAIGRFLKLPADETHLLTASLDFNRRANLLRALISRSCPPKQTEMHSALNIIQNESMRNIFAHSFMRSTETHIYFIERSRHGQYSAKEHPFTLDDFFTHVQKFTLAVTSFYDALGITDAEFEEFGKAALSVKTKA